MDNCPKKKWHTKRRCKLGNICKLQSELKKTRERGQTNKNSAILFFFQLKHPGHSQHVTKHRKFCKWLDTEKKSQSELSFLILTSLVEIEDRLAPFFLSCYMMYMYILSYMIPLGGLGVLVNDVSKKK